MVSFAEPTHATHRAEPLADTFLTMAELSAELRLSESTIRRLIANDDFPAPVKIGRRARRFSAKSVRAWLDNLYGSIETSADSDIDKQLDEQNAIAAELSDRQNEREISRDKK